MSSLSFPKKSLLWLDGVKSLSPQITPKCCPLDENLASIAPLGPQILSSHHSKSSPHKASFEDGCLQAPKKYKNKTEVTSVKLVLFKYVMSFETLTKVDQLTEIVRFG